MNPGQLLKPIFPFMLFKKKNKMAKTKTRTQTTPKNSFVGVK